MPEGDTIFRAARTLDRALRGKTITRFDTGYAQLSRVDVDTPIAGRTVEEVRAVGKHLLIALSGDLVLRTHMRMNGSWHIYRPGERWQRPRAAMRVLLETADFVAVGFDIPVAEFRTGAQLTRDPELRRLGPDLLGDFDAGEALRRLRARPEREIGDALLDQSAMAGAGNVFKSEVLFLCGVDPFTPVGDLTDERLRAVVDKTRELLAANVVDGKGDGIVTYHGFRRTTGRSDPTQRLWVYGRGGRPCRRCGTPIVFYRQGAHARVTYTCPRCQPRPAPLRSEPTVAR